MGIINDEVERLSALSHRVGDYLRDPAGNPRPMDPAEIALEVGMRLCGRNILRIGARRPGSTWTPSGSARSSKTSCATPSRPAAPRRACR